MIDEKFFKCKYVAKYQFGIWRHDYEVVCSRGAINFYYAFYMEEVNYCSLEIHHLTAPEHMKNHPPSALPCPVLGAPCWHYGTSIYANEYLLPSIKERSLDEIFQVLTNECAKRFNLPITS